MTERPILFSGEMVRALLAGTKTQTRRVVRPRHDWRMDEREDGTPWPYFRDYVYEEPEPVEVPCPYGAPGDMLWVKERWQWASAYWASIYRDPGATDAERAECQAGAGYYATHRNPECDGPWTSPLYMPRLLSRITLRVTSVRVERVQDISEEDARAEGVVRACFGGWTDGTTDYDTITAAQAFRALWESINGAESWAANPWVWVVGFERVEASHG